MLKWLYKDGFPCGGAGVRSHVPNPAQKKGLFVRQATGRLTTSTQGKGLYDISREVAAWVARQGFGEGLLTLHIPHTSASLLIQENADPDVLADLEEFFSRLVPEEGTGYRHRAEGSDDMPAHIRSALTATQLSIPLIDGALALGIWQGIYLFEHRRHPHRREVVLHLFGE